MIGVTWLLGGYRQIEQEQNSKPSSSGRASASSLYVCSAFSFCVLLLAFILVWFYQGCGAPARSRSSSYSL